MGIDVSGAMGMAPTTGAAPRVPIEVWAPGGSGIDAPPDVLMQRTGGIESTDAVVRQAYDSAVLVLDYYQREFGRSSFDGRGTKLQLRVHATDPVTGSPNNALWYNDEGRIWLGDGDGETFSPIGGAPDAVAHEFAHGVIDSELQLDYTGQQGALHESFADVFATGIDGNWQIAEGVYTPHVAGDALRDLANLTYRDWRTFPAWEDEVHRMSEVPSQAAYLVGSALGASTLRRIWYEGLTEHMPAHAGFAGARDATIAAASTLFGAGSRESAAVADAWTAAGIDSTTPMQRPASASMEHFDLAAVTRRAASLVGS